MSAIDHEDDVQDEADALGSDEVGTIGQDAFKTLCSQALITATPSLKDKYGWDYQLQWDRPGTSFEPPETCFVQVKTTAAGDMSAGIKLSNWKRMALSHAPWFVVTIELQEREPKNVYVVPVDEALVAQAVKRLHDRDRSVPEHRARMSISWGEAHRLQRPFHKSLLAAMTAHMGTSEAAYRQTKRAWIETTQREATHTEATFSIAAPSEQEFHRMLARFGVGLEESLPIKDFEVLVSSGGDDVAFEEGARLTLRDRKPHAEATMTLFDRDHSETVTLKLDAYLSGCVFPFLPNTRQIGRFVSPMVSFVWQPVDDEQALFTTHFEVPWDGAFTLSTLSRVCRAARMFADARVKGLRGSIACNLLKHPLEVELSGSPDDVFAPDFLESVRVVEDAGFLARYFDLDADSVELSADDLIARRWAIRVFAAGLDRTLGRIVPRVIMAPDEPIAGKKCAIVVVTVVPLGKVVLAGVFSLGGIADWRDGQEPGTGTMGIENADVKLRIKQLVPRERWDEARFRERIDAMVQTLDAEGYEVIVRKAAGPTSARNSS
jgi:hypothetical protein